MEDFRLRGKHPELSGNESQYIRSTIGGGSESAGSSESVSGIL